MTTEAKRREYTHSTEYIERNHRYEVSFPSKKIVVLQERTTSIHGVKAHH